MMSDLESAVASHSAERRNERLRKVTDLFVGGASQYSEEQVALFDGVIGRLAQDADVAARTELSARLVDARVLDACRREQELHEPS